MRNYLTGLVFCVLGATISLSSASPLQAQTATDSASISAITIEKKTTSAGEVSSENTTQILENLERLARNQTASNQIKDQYEGVTNKTRGFIAQITSLKDDSFKIITPDGEELFITPDKSTTIVRRGEAITGENLTLADWFAIDDWLVLVGVQNGESFQPRRLLVSSESLAPVANFVLRGQVKTSTRAKLDVEIIGQNTVETFDLNKSSNLVNQANETITYQELTAGQSVLLIGSEKDGKKTLQTLRLL